jgi:hypothetical protein
MNVAWIVLLLLIPFVASCSMRMYGHMTCKGECDLVIDRTVEEAKIDPLPDLPTDDAVVEDTKESSPPKGK